MAQDDPYAKEKGKPEVSACGKSTIGIGFNGAYLALVGEKVANYYVAVSGRPLENGKFDYSEERQKLKGTGPIPEGMYWINPTDLWENAWYKPVSSSAWGNFRITLRVSPGTETHGRGGFFIHGGSVAGSAGCIDLTNRMDSFVSDMKSLVGSSNNCFIPVKVSYK
jgi:hypothetical protein